jgi:hypothetical protein
LIPENISSGEAGFLGLGLTEATSKEGIPCPMSDHVEATTKTVAVRRPRLIGYSPFSTWSSVRDVALSEAQ